MNTSNSEATGAGSSPKKKRGKLKWIVGGIVGIAVVAGIAGAGGEDQAETTNTETATAQADTPAVDSSQQDTVDESSSRSEAREVAESEPATPIPEATATPVPAPTTTPESAGPDGYGGGTLLIGSDIPAGVYVSSNPSFCYWERLSGLSGEFADIIANDNVDGAQAVVDISAGDIAFSSSDCGTWVALADAGLTKLESIPGDGHWFVGQQVDAGVYRTVEDVDFCYWQRSSGAAGDFSEIISNDNVDAGKAIVEIAAGDAMFTSSGCGAWEQMG